MRVSGLLVLLALLMPLSGLRAADVDARQLKAATIVSMLRYVTWRTPAAGSAPLNVAVVGDSALAGALRDAAAGQTVDGRPLVVTTIVAPAQLPEPTPVVVVLSASQRTAAAGVARALEQRHVLTIGDGEGMSEAGLVIGVYVDGNRIRFDANTGAASRAGLTLSSRLLRLARIVG
ncbi:MAG TPA: YfiR family protein [Luteitalea sp.]|nr:YfiR family protein [Luteitalea sp.]